MLKSTTKSTVDMPSLLTASETNNMWESSTSSGRYLDFLFDKKMSGLYYVSDAGVVCTFSGSTSASAFNCTVLSTSVLSDCNSLSYSEDLDVMLAAGATGNVVVMTYDSSKVQYTGSTSSKYEIGISVNPSSAAWSPDALIFCVAGAEGTATSPDGVSWETHTGNDVPKNLIDLSYRKDLGCLFARSLNDKLFYASGDGENWVAVNSTPIPLETVSCVDYTPATGIYCAVGGTGKQACFSKDLTTWVSTTIANGGDIEAGSVIYMPSTRRYVLMPTSGKYYYTFDPSEWITDSAETHNEVPSDKNLGEFTASISSAIRTGTFAGIYPGDYFDFTNVAYEYLDENDETQNDTYSGRLRVMHLDYPQSCGKTNFSQHSVFVVPDTAMFSACMNDTDTTEGGYVGSKMRTKYLRRAEAIFKACFGADHVLTYQEYLVNEVTDGKPSGVELCNCTAELMDERMVFGSYRKDGGTHNKRIEPEASIFPHIQLAAFQHNHELAKDSNFYWGRNVASWAYFATVSAYGNANNAVPSIVGGVRPFAFVN